MKDAERANIFLVGDFIVPTEVSAENVAKIREQVMKYKEAGDTKSAV